MQLGSWQLDTVSGGHVRMDGGTMFGVVPKALWEKQKPADELNRIQMATNCVLARNGELTVLVDTGCGGKQSQRQREILALEDGEPLLVSLAALGVKPQDVDVVVLSHLHFDHAGGTTRRDGSDRIVPAFPKARYLVNRLEWQDATSGAPELRGMYLAEDFLPLEEAGQLELTDGDVEITAGLSTWLTGGHTRGHQMLVFRSEGQTAIYVADICPMTSHVRSHWCMSYDVDLLTTRRLKPQILGRAADEGWLVLWDHDSDMAASRLARDEKREFVVVKPMERL